jgi:hypothetical protein
MAAPRLVVGLSIGEEDVTKLVAITRSRIEPASRVERVRMLLAYRDDRPSLPLAEPWGCIIRQSGAVSGGPWHSVRWRRRTIVRGQVRRRRSHPSLRHGLCRRLAGKPRISAIHMGCGRRAFLYKSGFDPTVNVRLRHSFNGGHYRRGGLDVVKDAQHRLRRRERSSRP